MRVALCVLAVLSSQEKAPDFSVHAIAARGGAPVEGVLLRLIERFPPREIPEPRVEEKKTGPNGTVVFSALRPGTFQLVVADAPPGYAVEQFPETEIAKDRQLTIRLGPAARITGKVRAPDPSRFPALAVQVLQVNTESRVFLSRLTDADGSYEFDRLNRDLPLVVVAKAPGAHDRQRILNLGREETERSGVDFELVPYDPAKISIRLRAERGGKPLSRAPVTINRTDPIDGVLLAHSTLTGEDGTYAVPDLPPGRYLVRLLVAGMNGPPDRTVVVPADGAVPVEFVLPAP